MTGKSSLSRSIPILLALAALALSSPAPAPAQASKLPPLEAATGLEDWVHNFDISGLAAGKYNILVTGKDVAGNLSSGGSINVYVDPASDLPLVSVINPGPLQRVGGDLNIVGTCVDDDGVAKVEVSVDGGDFRPAEGGEFWSLYLKTAELKDGRRSLAIRGTDINGLVGPVVKLAFDLDRSLPLAQVDLPPPGTLVAGSIKLEGRLEDANGLDGLEVSLDGKAFSKVELKRGKDPRVAGFSLAMDTRKFPDGPRVVWLRSQDSVGSKGSAAFLLFVDNTRPSIELALPAKDAAVNGSFAVAGAVRDAIGIARLAFEFDGREKGEIALSPGNPFFSKVFDAGPVKGDRAKLVLIAEDRIGNVTKVELSPRIDREADKPRLRVSSPAPGATLGSGSAVWGSITDDDGVAAVVWTVDGGQARESPSGEVFALPVSDLPSGRHVLSLRARDSNGLLGDPVSLPLVIDGGRAVLSSLRLTSPQKPSLDYHPGLAFRVDTPSFLEGRIESPNPPAGASYTVAGGPARKLELQAEKGSNYYGFRIALDRTMPYGFVPLELSIVDSLRSPAVFRALLYSTDLSVAREDSGFLFDDPRIGEGGRVELGTDSPLQGAFYREDLESLRLEPPTGLVSATFAGRTVTIRQEGEGVSPPTVLVGRTKAGHEFRSQAFVFALDSLAPEVSIDPLAGGDWQSAAFVLRGRVSDSSGIASATWSLQPDGVAKALSLGLDGSFSLRLGPEDLPQGGVLIEIEARDRAGRTARAWKSLGFDSAPPRVSFLSPEAGSTVSGPEDVAALIEDASGLALVEFSPDGLGFAPVETRAGAFIHRADFAANPKAVYRVTDKAGNRALVRPELGLGAGKAPGHTGSLAVDILEGEARLELTGSSGARALSVLLPSLAEPSLAGALDSPRFASRLLVSGKLDLKGKVSSPKALKAAALSLDGGTTWASLFLAKEAKAQAAEVPLSLSIDTAKQKDGDATWLVRLEDAEGATGLVPLQVRVDNGKPGISLLPGPASLSGPRPMVVRIEDPSGLASASLALGGKKTALPVEDGGSWYAFWAEAPLAPGPGPAKATSLALAVEARDSAGNAAASSASLAWNPGLGLPQIQLGLTEAQAKALGPEDRITCTSSAEDGQPGLSASLDGAEPILAPSGSLGLSLSGLKAGKHSLVLEARDGLGRTASLRREFVLAGPAPRLELPSLGTAAASEAWVPGLELELGQATALSGTILAANGLASLEYRINGSAYQKASLGKVQGPGGPQAYSCPFPAGLPRERLVVELKAKDLLGLETLGRYDLHNILRAQAGSPPADTADALRFWDIALGPGGPGSGEAPHLSLAPGQTLEGWWNGRPLTSLGLVSPAPAQAAALVPSFEGGLLRLEAKAELTTGASLRLKAVTVDGDSFEWGPFSLAIDSAPPALAIESPAKDSWQKASLRVSGQAGDPNGIAGVEVSVNGGPFAALGSSPAPGAPGTSGSGPSPVRIWAFDAPLSLDGIADGPVSLDFLARDGSGRESHVVRYLTKDSVAPLITQVLPGPEEAVNGATTFIGLVADSGRLEALSFVPAADAIAPGPVFAHTLDLAKLPVPLAAGSGYQARDRAGNVSLLEPQLRVDVSKDRPVIDIQSPTELEVQRADFVVSGAVYDDDGVASLQYRIDGGAWARVEIKGSSFSLPQALADRGENEHLIEAQAEDIHGVRSEVITRRYRVSKEEPTALMALPALESPVRGLVSLSGLARDANGIESLSLSFDNGASYEVARVQAQDPAGSTDSRNWEYPLDTTLLRDGLHPITLRPMDAYGTQGFYATFIHVDNSLPVVELSLPTDASIHSGSLLVSGRVSDAERLAEARLELAPIGAARPALVKIDLGQGPVISKTVDVSSLPPGAYTLRLVGRDRAANESFVSRDIVISQERLEDRVEVLFPVEGEGLSGPVRVHGRARVAGGASSVTVLLDGADVGTATLDPAGYFSFDLAPDKLAEGGHSLGARAVGAGGRIVASPVAAIAWRAQGPWVSIDSLPVGAYLPERPFLRGRAGWAGTEPVQGGAGAKAKAAQGLRPTKVELSLDNGRTWSEASGTEAWKFRLETQDYPEGILRIVVRASFADPREGLVTATAKTLLSLDKTAPAVRIIEPLEDGRFNGVIHVAGSASDASGLASVGLVLRKGDKRGYEVPAFIQGLYLDAHFLGATFWDIGAGLSFFQDNVKLQVMLGQAPTEGRFGGQVFGAKLLANLGYLPASFILGADWDWLSAAFAVGANFSYFSTSTSGAGLVLGAVVAQIEFPKVTVKSWIFMRKFSTYIEGQAWFVSSDIQGGVEYRLAAGLRLGLF